MTQPVAYTFQAELLCPACTASLVSGKPWREFFDNDVEQLLDAAALLSGLDRTEEESFDSGDFPKVVFGCQLDSEFDTCGQCNVTLNA